MISPRVKVLLAAMKRLEEVDMASRAGVPDLRLRWARNRYATREERPCLSIAFVADEPVDEGRVSLNPDETARALAIDIIIDMEVETEASAEVQAALAVPPEDFDPTGLANMSWVLDLAMLSLRECTQDPLKDTTELGRMIDWVEDVTIDDDDELPDDDGRLVGRANVIYRVSSWDPTLLLERE